MFPLDSKEPYIKENGSRSTLGEMFGDAGADVAEVKAALGDEIKTRAALGAHNLLPCTATSQSAENKPTFTVNIDGTVLINGTNSSGNDIFFQICNYAILNGNKKYFLTGCPAGGATDTYNIVVQDWTNNTNLGRDTGNGASFQSTSNGVKVFIVIRSGKTISNLLFKPMIRLADDADSTYQPYAKTNAELSGNVSDIFNTLSIANSKDAITASTSFSGLKTNALYSMGDGNPWASAGFSAIVFVLKYSDATGMQIAFKVVSDAGEAGMCIRQCYNGNYGAWKTVTLS